MEKYNKLYNRYIIPGIRLNRLQQVRDILRGEIQVGRWKINDRLPSISELTKQTGLSRGSIQQVLKMLQNEGYIYSEDRKGIFLASTLPRGSKTDVKIGVAMMKEKKHENIGVNPPFVFQLHWILEEASRQNIGVKVIYFDKNEDWTKIDSVGGPFGKEISGILTPYPFSRPTFNNLPDDKIPLVFVGPHIVDSLPFVCGDTWYGTYHLTKKVIETGHTNIIACCRQEELPIETELFLKGYSHAMNEYNLKINHSAIEDSLKIPDGNMKMLREFLLKYDDATAIVSAWNIKARNIVSICDMIGKKVPEDISIVSRDSSPMRLGKSDATFVCFEYETGHAVKIAFDMLWQIIETRKCMQSCVMVPPTIKAGHSLVPPRKSL